MKLPKLHLRDLFWLVLVCALAVGWWVEHRARSQEAHASRGKQELQLVVDRLSQALGRECSWFSHEYGWLHSRGPAIQKDE
jgi:hypothetical protein